VETQCAAAFVYFLPRGGDARRGQSFAGSRQLAANDIQTYRELVRPDAAKAWFGLLPAGKN
jgi:hypothetical protein